MSRATGLLAIVGLLLGLAGLGLALPAREARADVQEAVIQQIAPPPVAPQVAPLVAQPVRPQLPPPVADVLQSGVLVVVSKASQRMHVFKDGSHWGSSPVSTGKRRHSTPAGVFPILQKRVFHRSNIYSNAPMPYMQRLTWRGIAIHAGYVPGYPASHGCIRLPRSFAKALFDLTKPDRTTVVVTNAPLRSEQGAVTLALNSQAPAAMPAAGNGVVMAAATSVQTIQLAAALSPAEAEAHWQGAVAMYPQLASFEKAVVPAVVGQRRYWRLRASAPGAHALCGVLKRSGQDCFNVI
ncbi:L,D-transpeptidase family protein [Novosphingobium subterraneum]|uniref:ErfK/YbiS/YcfS/YnhG family protein n=1 Tax=Novosphingobium subterraneum TaxID=48936 RepID=A0A0B9A132_9SPHN|nr:L,D-transpeptidase family protein [Novosphingobium subterraneum]KHS49051.1 ErfK/YbiS/YcfS/YnhG family protein [Novosphingobium subterraneum]